MTLESLMKILNLDRNKVFINLENKSASVFITLILPSWENTFFKIIYGIDSFNFPIDLVTR